MDEVISTIFLGKHKNLSTLISTQDFPKIANTTTWTVEPRGYTTYARGKVNGVPMYLHRALMLPPVGLDVDHVDGNGLNNTRRNLRVCSRRENLQNLRGRSNKFGAKGVYASHERFAARIKFNGVYKYLGAFSTVKEAAAAYDRAALELFGVFAATNEEITRT